MNETNKTNKDFNRQCGDIETALSVPTIIMKKIVGGHGLASSTDGNSGSGGSAVLIGSGGAGGTGGRG